MSRRAWLLAALMATTVAGCRWKAERAWACRDGLEVDEVADVPGNWQWRPIAALPELSDGSRYEASTAEWQYHHFAGAPPRVTVRRMASDGRELASGATHLHDFGRVVGWRLDGDELWLRAESRSGGEFRRFAPRGRCRFDRPGRCDPRERALAGDAGRRPSEGRNATMDVPPELGPELPPASELGVEGVVCTAAETPAGGHWLVTATYTDIYLYRVEGGRIQPLSSFDADYVARCRVHFGGGFATLVTLVERGGTSIGPLGVVEAHTIDVSTGERIARHSTGAIAREDLWSMVDSEGVHHIVWTDFSTYHYNVWRIEDPHRPDPPRHLFTKYFVAGARLEKRDGDVLLFWWGRGADAAEGEVPLCHGADDPQPVKSTMSPALGMTFIGG